MSVLRTTNPAAYYVEAIAAGAEDYYLAGDEAPGRWLGQGASDLGLVGRVEPDALRAVLAGLRPGSGDPLRARGVRRSGFDVTLSAPKSVSVLFALGRVEVGREVVRAHDIAVDAAVTYLEREACAVRRGGKDGYGIDTVPAEGFVAAAFRHRTSREGDPQIHSHVLIANATEGPDGRWTALHGTLLYEHGRTAGFVYQAVLRHELTQRLGARFRLSGNGTAEVIGVPDALRGLFSKRRHAINAQLDGRIDPRAAQAATLATRPDKQHLPTAELFRRWDDEAHQIRMDPEAVVRRAVRRPRDRERRRDPGSVPAGIPGEERTASERVMARLDRLERRGSPAGLDVAAVLRSLTTADATFERRAVVRAVAGSLHQGMSLDGIDVAVRQVLESPMAVPLDEGRWTTQEVLAVETAAVNAATASRKTGAAIAGPAELDTVLAARPALSAEQAEMVRRLCNSGHGVDIVVGHPGSGKTFALDAARQAWQRSGYQVIGAALAARAARGLQAEAGIPSGTLHGLLQALGTNRRPLAPGTVVVVDEAAMVGTRQLARLIAHTTAAKAKLVLVGDPKQLPAIEAGGLFTALADRLGHVALSGNRRQREPVERHIAADLRSGATATAVSRMSESGRLVTAETAEALAERMVEDWWTARAAGQGAVMLTMTRDLATDLNQRARARLTAAGQLGEVAAIVNDVEYAVGDQLVCLRNDRRLGVANGDTGVVGGELEAGLAVRIDDRVVVLPGRYLAAGHVAHSYALTVHKSQGLTCDVALLWGSEHLYAEAGYTALTRGRHANRIFVLAQADDHEHLPPERQDPAAVARAQLGRTKAKLAAHERAVTRPWCAGVA